MFLWNESLLWAKKAKTTQIAQKKSFILIEIETKSLFPFPFWIMNRLTSIKIFSNSMADAFSLYKRLKSRTTYWIVKRKESFLSIEISDKWNKKKNEIRKVLINELQLCIVRCSLNLRCFTQWWSCKRRNSPSKRRKISQIIHILCCCVLYATQFRKWKDINFPWKCTFHFTLGRNS